MVFSEPIHEPHPHDTLPRTGCGLRPMRVECRMSAAPGRPKQARTAVRSTEVA
jgi:hypothetical protein